MSTFTTVAGIGVMGVTFNARSLLLLNQLLPYFFREISVRLQYRERSPKEASTCTARVLRRTDLRRRQNDMFRRTLAPNIDHSARVTGPLERVTKTENRDRNKNQLERARISIKCLDFNTLIDILEPTLTKL